MLTSLLQAISHPISTMATPSSPDAVRDAQNPQIEQGKEVVEHSDEANEKEVDDPYFQDPEKATESLPQSTHSNEEMITGPIPVEQGQHQEQADQDPNIVDWDGPDDPDNPQNWTAKKKWGIVLPLGLITLITPLASSFFAPGVPLVLREFKERSSVIATFVVSVYILGFAIGPVVIAPLSELYGRMPIYNISNVLFVVFSIACAKSTSIGMLIAFRFLGGCAGATPVTLGGGSIADMFPQDQRAGAMAIWSMGPLLGPVVGPICGGFLVENLSWRWVFWILAITGGAAGLHLFAVGRETYQPVLLARKAAALRKSTGNPALRSKLAQDLPAKEIFIRAIVRPMKMLLLSPIIGLMSLYVGINYGILYLFFTTITFVFKDQYGFSSGAIGLAYIGLGIGMITAMILVGFFSDKIILKHQKNGRTKPEHRLSLVLALPGAIGLPIGVIVYGWTTKYKVHWIVPIIFMSLVGAGNVSAMMTIQTYLVDSFTIYSASVIAANTILRSMFGAFLPLCGLSMYNALGLGWGNSLLAFVSMAFIPVPILFRIYGERIRTNKRFHVQF